MGRRLAAPASSTDRRSPDLSDSLLSMIQIGPFVKIRADKPDLVTDSPHLNILVHLISATSFSEFDPIGRRLVSNRLNKIFSETTQIRLQRNRPIEMLLIYKRSIR